MVEALKPKLTLLELEKEMLPVDPLMVAPAPPPIPSI
jgi:hypothetical protein